MLNGCKVNIGLLKLFLLLYAGTQQPLHNS